MEQQKVDYLVRLENGEALIEVQQRQARQETVEQFRNCRKGQCMTQAQLGRQAGISQPNITRFESGSYNPSLDFLVKIAAAMGKRVKVTLEDEDGET